MRQSSRLILNTGVTYARMGITVVLGLVTVRLVVRALGAEDYGVLTALGAAGGILMILSESLTASCQRHLAYEIGKDDREGLKRVFNTALFLYGSATLLTLVVGVLLLPVLMNVVDIPEGREQAARWAYLFNLLGLALVVTGVPFRATFVAHQLLVYDAFFSTLQSVLMLAGAVILPMLVWDRLVTWSLMQTVVFGIVTLVPAVLAMARFPDIRPSPRAFDRRRLSELGGFAWWMLIARGSNRLRMQGGTLMLNIVFGPIVNAAYAIAIRVVDYQNSLSTAMIRVVQPALVAAYARGHTESYHRLGIIASKACAFVGLLFIFPFVIDTRLVLELWLGPDQVTDDMVVFVQLVSVISLLQSMSTGLSLAVQATGRIARYTVVFSLIMVSPLLFAGVLFAVLPDVEPWALPAVSLAVSSFALPYRAHFVGRLSGLPGGRWLRAVVVPVGAVAATGCAAAAWPRLVVAPGPSRLILEALAFGLAALPVVWLIGLDRWERRRALRVLDTVLAQVRSRAAGPESSRTPR